MSVNIQKVSIEVRAAILAALDRGERQTDIAKKYGVSQGTVSRIRTAENYAKLSNSDVQEIKELIGQGYQTLVVARKFGVTTATVQKVMKDAESLRTFAEGLDVDAVDLKKALPPVLYHALMTFLDFENTKIRPYRAAFDERNA